MPARKTKPKKRRVVPNTPTPEEEESDSPQHNVPEASRRKKKGKKKAAPKKKAKRTPKKRGRPKGGQTGQRKQIDGEEIVISSSMNKISNAVIARYAHKAGIARLQKNATIYMKYVMDVLFRNILLRKIIISAHNLGRNLINDDNILPLANRWEAELFDSDLEKEVCKTTHKSDKDSRREQLASKLEYYQDTDCLIMNKVTFAKILTNIIHGGEFGEGTENIQLTQDAATMFQVTYEKVVVDLLKTAKTYMDAAKRQTLYTSDIKYAIDTSDKCTDRLVFFEKYNEPEGHESAYSYEPQGQEEKHNGSQPSRQRSSRGMSDLPAAEVNEPPQQRRRRRSLRGMGIILPAPEINEEKQPSPPAASTSVQSLQIRRKKPPVNQPPQQRRRRRSSRGMGDLPGPEIDEPPQPSPTPPASSTPVQSLRVRRKKTPVRQHIAPAQRSKESSQKGSGQRSSRESRRRQPAQPAPPPMPGIELLTSADIRKHGQYPKRLQLLIKARQRNLGS